MGVLGLQNDGAGASLLVHSIQMMQGTMTVAKRLRVRNRRGNIRLRQQNGFGQSSAVRQVAGQRGRKSTTRTMGRSGALAFGFENFLLDSPRALEAE